MLGESMNATPQLGGGLPSTNPMVYQAALAPLMQQWQSEDEQLQAQHDAEHAQLQQQRQSAVWSAVMQMIMPDPGRAVTAGSPMPMHSMEAPAGAPMEAPMGMMQ